MRQTLLACYAEFSEILKQMAITHVSSTHLIAYCVYCAWFPLFLLLFLLQVSVDGRLVKSSELFSEELSMAELKVSLSFLYYKLFTTVLIINLVYT